MGYDLIVVGTSFAGSFFLREYLARARRNAKVLVLERGPRQDHGTLVDRRRELDRPPPRSMVTNRSAKPWLFAPTFGGTSNMWFACTPRMTPEDFRLRSTHGHGMDWPLSYDDLEPCYGEAEHWLSVSGPSEDSPFERSRPYPQPPHRFSAPDKVLKAAYPRQFFHQPTARARTPPGPGRSACCNNGVCSFCPVDAKFTVLNSMAPLYDDPRVTLALGARADRVEIAGPTARGVTYTQGGSLKSAEADAVALGANALFNPHILLRSDLTHPALGRYLHEQVGVVANVFLDGLDNFSGSTAITGHGYMLYGGDRRKRLPGCLMETWNAPTLRPAPGRWRQFLRVVCLLEDIPRAANRVVVDPDAPERVQVEFTGISDYARRGVEALGGDLERALAPLPIERLQVSPGPRKTEGHILGTTRMGDDPTTSVVDRHLVHHVVRNLYVLGGSVFPTGAPANPTLTIAALSIWAARKMTT